MIPIRYYLFLICFLTNVRLLAQAPSPLDRLISVDIRNEKLENALRQISRAGRFEFSYDPGRLESNTLITIRLTNTPVREVLNRVFQNRVAYKSRGNHVILLRVEPIDTQPKSFLLDGYILDEQTGERIAKASIFEKTTLASTVSNPFGYYRLQLPTTISSVRLDVRKQAYLGETVLIRSRVSHAVNIRMTPQPLVTSPVQPLSVRITEDTVRPAEPPLASVAVAPPAPVQDTTPKQFNPIAGGERAWNGITKLFLSAQQAIHDINLSRDTLYRDWQVSFVPFIGTNHRLSGRISNRYSINALVGYSFGVRAFEVGGLMNLVRADVQGFQAAGLANVVGGRVNGFQAGGLVNIVAGKVSGVQAGGLMNVVASDVQGVQMGGLLNVAGQSVQGVQLAGLINYTRRNVNGWQISGIVNRAHRVTSGLQISLINVADTVGSVPVGLISYVHKGGYQRIEVAANEVNLLNVTLRTGVRKLYNILAAGHSFDRVGSPRLSAGYGLGSAVGLSRSTLLNLEAIYHHLFYFDRNYSSEWNSQIRINTLIETKLSSHLSLAFGPSFNWYFGSDSHARPLLQPDVTLFADRTDSYSSALHSGWIGFQVGLRYGKW
ncbi:STN and carboxypeptidase regulatory-like domain-containing protein [Spirosoma sp. KNUC1025]|uniref:STN and carboxypeptidase regulatory-like domain-containing protein n=1 Tax=Spirosoma sp. KNUC1025 TaxID=2894082 RepID=UPI00386B5329|nr:STN domain-containing protein [Spirosoma sp. KNUC1025]